jgi:hypothetical protein
VTTRETVACLGRAGTALSLACGGRGAGNTPAPACNEVALSQGSPDPLHVGLRSSSHRASCFAMFLVIAPSYGLSHDNQLPSYLYTPGASA